MKRPVALLLAAAGWSVAAPALPATSPQASSPALPATSPQASSPALPATSPQASSPAPENADRPRVEVTEVSSVLYNFDNRDTRAGQPHTLANDGWGLWYNRLNLHSTWAEWNVGLRLDNAWFFASPDPTQIGLDLVALRARPLPPGAATDGEFFRQKVDEAGIELSNRYLNWAYPAKWWVGWSTREVELTLGDFYAQLGKGFVLSVRKQDELSSDTTIRGARATTRLRLGELRLEATALGGAMNPLRLDEASGRWLATGHDGRDGLGLVTEAGMPVAVPTDFLPDGRTCAETGTCSYHPDRLAAGQLELGSRAVKWGLQGSLLDREVPLGGGPVRGADQVLTGSTSLDLPRLGEHAVYAEAAFQGLTSDGRTTVRSADGETLGHALHVSSTLSAAPFTFLVEGKSHRRFHPLAANVHLGRAREFSTVQYSAPPTTEALWVDSAFNAFNTCVSGGRVKTDVETASNATLSAWVGRWSTWAESAANDGCTVRRRFEDRVWDVAMGLDISTADHASRGTVTVGGRHDERVEGTVDTPSGPTPVFYQEAYVRYDVIHSLGGPFALQLQGWHRRRREPDARPSPWLEGQHLTGLEWAPKLSTAVGVEYDTRPGVPGWYLNGQVGYKVTSDTSVSLFAGQRRGALRCVAGICRVFPPFEGARLDVTARF